MTFMGEIVQFRGGAERTGGETPMSMAPTASGHEIRRAGQIRAAAERRDPFRPDDQARVASHLHRLLEETVRTDGIPKRDVAERMGFGADVVTSSKRLDPYTLPDEAGPARLARLAKKPHRYLDFACCLAGLTGRSEDALLCLLFEGATFGTRRGADPNWDDAPWANLVRLLHRMAGGVIRAADLDRYWQEAVHAPGTHDPVEARLEHGPWPIDREGSESGGVAGLIASPADLAPIPSVVLGTRPMAELEEVALMLADGRTVVLDLALQLEVRLALAPVGSSGAIGPLLEFRSRLDAAHEDGPIEFDDPHLVGGAFPRRIRIGGAWCDIAGDPDLAWAEVDWGDEDLPWAESRAAYGHASYAWHEITAEALEAFLDPALRPLTVPTGVVDRSAGTPTRFAKGTPGHALSLRLLEGDLEHDLLADARHWTEELSRLRREVGERVGAAEAEAEARWHGMGQGRDGGAAS